VCSCQNMISCRWSSGSMPRINEWQMCQVVTASSPPCGGERRQAVTIAILCRSNHWIIGFPTVYETLENRICFPSANCLRNGAIPARQVQYYFTYYTSEVYIGAKMHERRCGSCLPQTLARCFSSQHERHAICAQVEVLIFDSKAVPGNGRARSGGQAAASG
jgi:hypothetical protein